MNRPLLILASGAVSCMFLTSAPALSRPQSPSASRIEAMKNVRETKAKAAARRAADWEAELEVLRRRRRVTMELQLRPFYRFELMSLRAACRLTTEQLRTIRPETDAAFDRAIARLSEAELKPMARMSPASPADLDYETVIREAVLAVASRHVPAERWAAFQEDRARREANRKQAGLDFLVATLDRELRFTGRQRDQIRRSLSDRWDNRWYSALEVTLGQTPCVPPIPDGLIRPHLSETQREIWGCMYKFEGPLWGVVLDHGGDPEMENALGAVPKVKARGGTRGNGTKDVRP